MAASIHHNMPMSSNAVVSKDGWDEGSSPQVEMVNGGYKVGGMKIGAATSTNFMKNGAQGGITSQ